MGSNGNNYIGKRMDISWKYTGIECPRLTFDILRHVPGVPRTKAVWKERCGNRTTKRTAVLLIIAISMAKWSRLFTKTRDNWISRLANPRSMLSWWAPLRMFWSLVLWASFPSFKNTSRSSKLGIWMNLDEFCIHQRNATWSSLIFIDLQLLLMYC